MSAQTELEEPPTDIISALKYAPNAPSKLLASSWDRHVYLYDTHEDGADLVQKFEHPAPVLDVCFGSSEDEAFSACLDNEVKRINLQTGELTTMSEHKSGVKSVVYDPENSILVSASWDCTLHVHFPDKPDANPFTIQLPHKPFSMSLSPSKLVVAMAQRSLHIYDVPDLAALSSQPSPEPLNMVSVQAWQNRESSLKFMTRAVACMADDKGYASSSIEGRVAVEWFDPSDESQARKYAFKCHRQVNEGVDVVYPVNALAFHPELPTFATGGGDSVVALWDAVAKRRIKQYKEFSASVAALAFSPDGKYLAVAVSPGFEDGQDVEIQPGMVAVYFRKLGEGEAKGPTRKE